MYFILRYFFPKKRKCRRQLSLKGLTAIQIQTDKGHLFLIPILPYLYILSYLGIHLTPIIIVLSAGADPMGELQKLAELY